MSFVVGGVGGDLGVLLGRWAGRCGDTHTMEVWVAVSAADMCTAADTDDSLKYENEGSKKPIGINSIYMNSVYIQTVVT